MLTSNFWKLEVGGWSPSAEGWALHIGCQIPKFNLPEVGSWNPISRRRLLESNLWKIELGFKLPEVGSSKSDTTKLVGATCLNTSPAQKRVEKREKTVVLEAGNRLEETPVETRGDP